MRGLSGGGATGGLEARAEVLDSSVCVRPSASLLQGWEALDKLLNP